jgi:hypothetical protein
MTLTGTAIPTAIPTAHSFRQSGSLRFAPPVRAPRAEADAEVDAGADHPLTLATPVRLTRRGRVVLVMALFLVATVAFTLGRVGTSQAATDGPAVQPYHQTTIHSGETLWSVAMRVAPGHDPRLVVEQLVGLNHLGGGAVQVGQQLLLPRIG